MKKYLLAGVAFAALSATGSALAADLGARTYYNKAPMMAPAAVYNWTGFYIGGHIGGAFNGSNGFVGLNNSNNDGRFLGGGQIGADYQFSQNWVLGVEGQYSWLANNNNNATVFTGAGTGFTYFNSQRGLASVTGRLGYTWGPSMLYVKGGYAYSDNHESMLFNGLARPFDRRRTDGYTIGGGLEYMFTQNWSGKIEYQYYDFGSSSFNTIPQLAGFGSSRFDEHTLKVGLNYRFNLGKGPVVARY